MQELGKAVIANKAGASNIIIGANKNTQTEEN